MSKQDEANKRLSVNGYALDACANNQMDVTQEPVRSDFYEFSVGDEGLKPVFIGVDMGKPEQPEWDGEGLPPVGVELDAGKVFGGSGVKEWFCIPRLRVVAHHLDGVRFFTEIILYKDGNKIYSDTIEIYSTKISSGDSGLQWRPLKSEAQQAEEEEREKYLNNLANNIALGTLLMTDEARQAVDYLDKTGRLSQGKE